MDINTDLLSALHGSGSALVMNRNEDRNDHHDCGMAWTFPLVASKKSKMNVVQTVMYNSRPIFPSAEYATHIIYLLPSLALLLRTPLLLLIQS